MSYYSDAECKIIKTELLDEEAEKLITVGKVLNYIVSKKSS